MFYHNSWPYSCPRVLQDAGWFLGAAQREEDRLLVLCAQCEKELLSDTITEEGTGNGAVG